MPDQPHGRQRHEPRTQIAQSPDAAGAGEPVVGQWRTVDDEELGALIGTHLTGPGPHLVLVDGRSGAGKSTFAARVAELTGGHVVHADDVAWHLHPTDWDDALVSGILDPWSRGAAVSYRPPGWQAKGRPGAAEVPACGVLVVEGVGAGRRRLAERAALTVWVNSDRDEARRRGIERDIVTEGRTRAQAHDFWDEWARSEEPFLADERPWERAALIVNGTPDADPSA